MRALTPFEKESIRLALAEDVRATLALFEAPGLDLEAIDKPFVDDARPAVQSSGIFARMLGEGADTMTFGADNGLDTQVPQLKAA